MTISVNTSVGESESTRIPNTIGQGSVGAALVSSLNIGSALDEVFKDIVTTHIGTLGLNTLNFQNDIDYQTYFETADYETVLIRRFCFIFGNLKHC